MPNRHHKWLTIVLLIVIALFAWPYVANASCCTCKKSVKHSRSNVIEKRSSCYDEYNYYHGKESPYFHQGQSYDYYSDRYYNDTYFNYYHNGKYYKYYYNGKFSNVCRAESGYWEDGVWQSGRMECR